MISYIASKLEEGYAGISNWFKLTYWVKIKNRNY